MKTHPNRENIEWDISYVYNANQSELKRVLLVGDSICNGYHKFVREELEGYYYLSFYATSKCITDVSFEKSFEAVLAEYDYELIHFNNGLHSLTKDGEVWKSHLSRVLNSVRKLTPQSKWIWCSSTPVHRPQPVDDPAQIEEINKVSELNDLAIQFQKETAFIDDTNDLFSLIDPSEGEHWVDPYHFHEPARRMQAQQVAKSILNCLGLDEEQQHRREMDQSLNRTKTGPDGALG